MAISGAFALVLGSFSGLTQYISITYSWKDPALVGMLFTVIGLLIMSISPIIVLIVFYRLGKKYDLKRNLGVAILSVYLGLLIANYITQVIFQLWLSSLGGTMVGEWYIPYLVPLFQSAMSSLSTFFVIFTGLALGFLRRGPSLDILPESSPTSTT